jgi:hypothetical protein
MDLSEKILSFLTRQMTHITACQTIMIPLGSFLPRLRDDKKPTKREMMDPGNTSTTPNHIYTSTQIDQAKGHKRNKWSSFSTPPPHTAQDNWSPARATPLEAKFNFVGILKSKACHEKTTTFEGAQLSHTL